MAEFPTPATAFGRQNPFAARLLENRRLNQQGSSKDTRHIVIELGSAGPTYTCGDSLGVFPRNPEPLVREFIDTLGNFELGNLMGYRALGSQGVVVSLNQNPVKVPIMGNQQFLQCIIKNCHFLWSDEHMRWITPTEIVMAQGFPTYHTMFAAWMAFASFQMPRTTHPRTF